MIATELSDMQTICITVFALAFLYTFCKVMTLLIKEDTL